MAEESFQEKTEPATGKKRDDARQKGKVVKSMDMNAALGLVFGLLILYFGGAAIAANLAAVARNTFANAAQVQVNVQSIQHYLSEGFVSFGVTVAPVVLGLMVVGLASNFAQVGFMWTLEPLQPSWEKVNPLSGVKKILGSRRSMVEMLKGFFKVSLVGGIAYASLKDVMAQSVTLMDSDVEALLGFMAKASLGVTMKLGLAFLALAIVDYLYQRFEYEKELRMTKEEVKEETKMMEGDPQIKGKIRHIQRQIAYKRMMQEVPKADVVITNPTHFAVAVKYDMAKMHAPRVVAKGADHIAFRIKELAKTHQVPIVEDKLLAQMLYKTVDVGEEIPEKLFQAVAQVLAYIYRLRNLRPNFGTR